MKQKLLYISVLISILPLILFQVYFFYSSERMIIEREIENDFQELKSSSLSISEKLSYFRDNMRLVAKLSLLRVSLEYDRPEPVNSFLGSESSLERNFSKLFVLNASKKFFTSNETSPDVFQLIKSSKTFENVSNRLDLSGQDDMVMESSSLIYIATKIKDENENILGYLIGEVNPLLLQNEIQRLRTRIKADEISFSHPTKDSNTHFCQKLGVSELSISLCFKKVYKETFIDSNFIIILLLTTVSLAFIFGLIYRIFFSKILKPFYDFLENLKAVTTGTYSLISEHSKYPEIEMLIKSSNQIVSKLKSYQNEEIEKEKSLAVSRMATQAAHDIRSPLEVLKSLEDDLRRLPEEPRKRLKLGITRIEEIAFNLLQVNKGNNFDNLIQSEDLLQLLSSICIEKKIEYRHLSRISIQEEFSAGYGAFSNVNKTAFKNIISNIINNSVEATTNDVSIIVNLKHEGNLNRVRISDNGPGIESNILKNLLTSTITTKIQGNGLGLHNAYLDIKKWNGEIEIKSSNNGTEIEILLPCSLPSQYFLPVLDISTFTHIIVVDDDPGFLELWKQKLGKNHASIQFKTHLRKEDISDDRTLVISDFDLGEGSVDGIELLESLPQSTSRILTTALSEDQAIREACIAKGLKLLPKNTLNHLPIAHEMKSITVLIDDDKLMHIHWKILFNKRGLELLTYFSVEDFIKASSGLEKNSVIYIDSNLSQDLKGELESKALFDLGFTTIFLTTGYTDFDTKPYPWIKGAIGKSPII